ncbi:MAG: hypothetical protein HFJ12_00605 [Bacilli bacterium]|nr:hypothetical protein [Bacilli bacterium]
MAKFNIEVVETLSRVVEIDADTLDDALFMAEEMYNNEEIELDYNDKVSTDYKEYPYPRFQDDFNVDLNYSKEDNKLKVKSGNIIESEHSCNNSEELLKIVSETFAKWEREDFKKRMKVAKEMKRKLKEEKEK